MFRIAIFGLGNVAQRIHLPACSTLADARVVAACEPDPARRADIGQRFGLRGLYADAATLLEQEKPDIVLIGTPPSSHRDLCLLALAHGAHVLCEKPFVQSLQEADDVITAAERAGRQVAVNNQYRHMQIYRLPKERIASGDFGPLYFVNCWQQIFLPPERERGWRKELRRFTLFENGNHAIDLLCFFFEAFPVSVSALMPRVRPEIQADVLDLVTLRFPGERVAHLTYNRLSQAPERYLEMRLDCERASLRISLGGVARAALDWSKALGRPTARLSFVKGGEARVESGGRSRVLAREWQMAFASATATHLRGFLDALREERVPESSAHHARSVLRAVFAAYESAERDGEVIRLG